MPSRRVAMLVMFVVALLACTSSSTGSGESVPADVKCYSNATTGTCGCTQFDYGPAAWGSDAVAAADCNTPPAGGSWQCCVDAFTAGKKTCTCGNWHCREDGRECMCSWDYQLSIASSAPRVARCSFTYCRRQNGVCTCSEVQDAPGETVESCSESDPMDRDCSEQPATSCANVEWAQPAPAGSTSGDPNKPECSNDTDCSSKCSDCPGCRSGSCKCGRRGVSGSCIF